MDYDPFEQVEVSMIDALSVEDLEAMPRQMEAMTRKQAILSVAVLVKQANHALRAAREILDAGAYDNFESELDDAKLFVQELLARHVGFEVKPDDLDLEFLAHATEITFEVLVELPFV